MILWYNIIKELSLLNKEIWKRVIGYEGIYEVSSLGKVRKKGKFLKGSITKGYRNIKLQKGSERKSFLVHRLVALAFLENPLDKPFVNHIDGVKSNNNVNNLEWCTASENNEHALATGLKKANIRIHLNDVIEDYKNGINFINLSKKYGVCKNIIPKLLKEHGIKIRHGGYKVNRYDIDRDKMKNMIDKGISNKLIAEQLGVPAELITRYKHMYKKGEI